MLWSRSARGRRWTCKRRSSQAILGVEWLETRALPTSSGWALALTGGLSATDAARIALVAGLASFDQTFTGTGRSDEFRAGSGRQLVIGLGGNDHIRSLADGGEPDPAQTGGAGRINVRIPAGAADDVFFGGAGADIFEFMPLLNGRTEVVDQYRSHSSGKVNWHEVAGENDNVHDHWVEGFGNDIIVDYSKAEGDQIKITGHTVALAGIDYGVDAGGAFSLITIRSDQGAGGGAHNGDILGTIKVYGDRVTAEDVCLDAGPHNGIERLAEADRLAANNGGGGREVVSASNGDTFGGAGRVVDLVTLGRGSQTIDTGAGNDRIVVLGDGGEPAPAQQGGKGRVNAAVDSSLSTDVVRGGLGKDQFVFRLMLNARKEILARHTRADGTINWRRVAGENKNVHDHWVEGLGNDVILDFNKGDGDQIRIEGHTVCIASISYGVDAGGAFSLISLKSNQGAAGAHNKDFLGTIKVYGDKVTRADVTVTAEVYHGIDQLMLVDALDNSAGRAAGMHGAPSSAFQEYVPDRTIVQTFLGSERGDKIRAGSGRQFVDGAGGNDHFLSFADNGEPDPAQTGGSGRATRAVPAGAADDVFRGGAGADTFEFLPLLNARPEVLDQYRSHNSGCIDWHSVAGENDNVHDHWVEGFGNDTILDYSRAEGDRIKVTGHTVRLASITYGSDARGTFSLITIRSDQGAGGGAHNGDILGTIKVYGDKVTVKDVAINAAPHNGMELLREADRLAEHNGGGTRVVTLTSAGATYVGGARVTDLVTLGRGNQSVDTGAGNDRIVIMGDGGEPDPAQTGGSGRITSPVDPSLSTDVVRGGLGKDQFVFKLFLNARPEIIAKHTRADGSVDWHGVAGENNNVHDHWVESLGNDVILDFDKGDGDQIRIEGHTVSIAAIEYGSDDGGTFSLIILRSDQGAGGGAHNGDLLGTIKVYGDQVTEGDICVDAGVHHGIDQLNALVAASAHDAK